MIEKIRISLWEVISIFVSGFLLAVFALSHLMYYDYFSANKVRDFLVEMPTALAVLLFPVLFWIAGMLLEPISNYAHKLLIRRVFSFLLGDRKQQSAGDEEIVRFIKSNCLGELNGKIENPFFLCKEYVETKQLSTTFMIFLSRFGFYRNASFLSFLCAVIAVSCATTAPACLAMAAFWLLMAGILFRRAEDFYSYQAPSIYHAFLIDKLSWAPMSAPRQYINQESIERGFPG